MSRDFRADMQDAVNAVKYYGVRVLVLDRYEAYERKKLVEAVRFLAAVLHVDQDREDAAHE